MITVADNHRVSAGFMQDFGVNTGKTGKFADRRIFFKDNLTVVIRINLQRVTFADPHGPSNFFWNDDPSQIVDSSDNSSGFHI